MKTLSQKQILALHSALIKEFGGSDGVRDEGLLESALAAPFQTFGGEPVYHPCRRKRRSWASGLSATTLLWTATSGSALMPCWFFWL